jgi:hypothetical protein
VKFFNDGGEDTWRPPSFPNHDPERVPTPVGEPCLYCQEPIKESDCGILMPHMGETVSDKPWHIICLRKSLGVEGASA